MAQYEKHLPAIARGRQQYNLPGATCQPFTQEGFRSESKADGHNV